jgi:rare lipoprotein A
MRPSRCSIATRIGLAAAVAFGAMFASTGTVARAGRHHHHHHLSHHVSAMRRAQVGRASYYGPRRGHLRTASGVLLRPGQLTAASRTLPLGSKAKVTNVATGRSVHVVINDRGPFAKGRILDVSRAAAERLGMLQSGVSTVEVRLTALPEGAPPG